MASRTKQIHRGFGQKEKEGVMQDILRGTGRGGDCLVVNEKKHRML